MKVVHVSNLLFLEIEIVSITRICGRRDYTRHCIVLAQANMHLHCLLRAAQARC